MHGLHIKLNRVKQPHKHLKKVDKKKPYINGAFFNFQSILTKIIVIETTY